MDLHELAEQRSLEIHRSIAELLRADPAVLEQARATLEEWTARGRIGAHYASEWSRKLARPVEEVAAFIGSDTEQARALRQASPFVGIVSPRKRWEIWRQVRQRAGR